MTNRVGLAAAILDRKTAREGDVFVLSLDKLDPRFQSLPRGGMTEITGSRSSGRTAMVHAILATATTQGESCALVDCSDAFHPASAADNGVELDRIFWVRCQGRPDRALKAADWILHAGGFGVVLLDLCEVAPALLRRIPLSWWYRFRNVIENSRTTFLVAADQHVTGSAAVRVLGMDDARPVWTGSQLDPLLAGIDMAMASRKPSMAEPARCGVRLAG
ncbi:MAG: hypothetical protein ABI972_27900 [Acidobacteriota bacterium]